MKKRFTIMQDSSVIYVLCLLFLSGCHQQISTSISSVEPASKTETSDNRLNILWIVAEDLSHYLPMFGDSTIQTPHLSRLAAEGVCYDNFFTPAAVCAPARSAIAMGMYPTRLGSNHMRTGPWYKSGLAQSVIDNYSENSLPEGVNAYEAIAPQGARMMSEYLRMQGYYCSNNAKEDYQFQRTITSWDESSRDAHWRNRKEGQPFFSIFNLEVTHESQIWKRQKDSLWVAADLAVAVPPYLPDTEVGRRDVRQMYSNIKQMDAQVGKILHELEEDGLLDNTIIFWYTDHGGPLPRQKRLLYDSGIHVPLIIRFPDEANAGTRNDDLVSFIDLAPTTLSLAGISPQVHFDGKAFLGEYKSTQEAEYVFAAADRFDGIYDAVRAVRDKRYKLIEYLQPDKPMLLKVAYREQMPIMSELHRLKDEGLLTKEQALWYREKKPAYEFFDTWSDPHELNDLYEDNSYSDKIKELTVALNNWKSEAPDPHIKDERDYIASLWPEGKKPVCSNPSITNQGGTVKLSTNDSSSIGYQMLKADDTLLKSWDVYTRPIQLKQGHKLAVKADRVGFSPSEVVWLEL
jgi:arylsulfatase A-like enzyme